MRILNLFLLVFSTVLISSCSGGKPEAITSEKNIHVTYPLPPGNIFRLDSVDVALKSADALQKAESRKLFMTGLDLLANKNDAAASVEYFKEAIFYYPDEKNYQHLFKAYVRSNGLALADSVNEFLYEIIGPMDFMFNRALVFAARKDTAACIEALNGAIANGFAFKEKITEEKLFDFLKEAQSFQSLMVTHFEDDKKIKEMLFKAFIKTIPGLSLPFEIPSDSAQRFNFDHYINYDFALFIPGMEDSRFSRDVSNEYMYVGTFKCEAGQALIYKSYQMIADTLNPVSVNLIVYDSLGTVVSQQEIGCFCSPLESKGFKIWQDLSFEMSTYKTKWEFDPLEKGYAGNKVLSKEQSAHATFKITKENTITETHVAQEVASGN